MGGGGGGVTKGVQIGFYLTLDRLRLQEPLKSLVPRRVHRENTVCRHSCYYLLSALRGGKGRAHRPQSVGKVCLTISTGSRPAAKRKPPRPLPPTSTGSYLSDGRFGAFGQKTTQVAPSASRYIDLGQ